MASSRWHQDREVAELIEHFNVESKFDHHESLTLSECATILKEIARCRNDFIYAARNYFWITNKKSGDQLLSLWPGQELILQKLMEIKARGLPQKLLVIKARQLGAMDPNTKVLTSHLKWVSLDTVSVGDTVLSVDEFPLKRNAGRKFRKAVVLDKWAVDKPAYRLKMENGVTLVATADHKFLCKKRHAVDYVWVAVNEKVFDKKTRSPIRVGDEIRFTVHPWVNADSFEDGWFAGLLDGEGSYRAKDNGGMEVTVSQVAGAVLERAKHYLTSRGYPFRIEVDARKAADTSKLGKQPVYKLVVSQIPQVMRLIGSLAPARLSGRDLYAGKELPSGGVGVSTSKVVSIEALDSQRMVDIRTTTGTFIAEGFVTHNCSTLIEALIAWSTMYFSGRNALVVSYDRSHTSDVLFPIMQFIYDRMPWWMQPTAASRKEEGIFFENPDPKSRRFNPGLNSRIYVKGANSTTGVGQGIRLNAVHISEFCDYEERQAIEIIDEDMTNALVETPDTFAILESTAKGANTYGHKLWKKNVELVEQAEWFPLFLPWFFEDSRRRPVMVDFRMEKSETQMKERVVHEWVRCDEPVCRQFHYRYRKGEDRAESLCITCRQGHLAPFVLDDDQLAWIQHRRKNAAKDDKSARKLRQEMCSSAEESFQVSGIQIFGDIAQDFANSTVRDPLLWGDFDKAGKVHGCDGRQRDWREQYGYFPCLQHDCTVDHTYDEAPLRLWEWPVPGAEYSCGADVAEGLGGRNAYSVGSIIRLGGLAGDTQVAVWRSNTIGPIAFAAKLAQLGRLYNQALMAPEVNRYDIVLGYLRLQHNYGNMYRWKHLDSINMNTQKLGWWTTSASRPRLWQTFKAWLQQEVFFVRSSNLAEEMKNFTKEYEEDYMASGDQDSHDDELMATMIGLYVAHESDYNDSLEMIAPKADLTMESARYWITCLACQHVWPSNVLQDLATNPEQFAPSLQQLTPEGPKQVRSAGGTVCPSCGSRMVQVDRNVNALGSDSPVNTMENDLWREAGGHWTPAAEWTKHELPDYDTL